MGEASPNGKKKAKPKVKLEHPNGGAAVLGKERYFDVEVVVRITGYGDPDKEASKYIDVLKKVLDLNFPRAEVEPILVLP